MRWCQRAGSDPSMPERDGVEEKAEFDDCFLFPAMRDYKNIKN
jgi:hypothetical protein